MWSPGQGRTCTTVKQRQTPRESDFGCAAIRSAVVREPNAISYAQFYSRSHDVVIRVYDESGNVIDAHENAGRLPRMVG